MIFDLKTSFLNYYSSFKLASTSIVRVKRNKLIILSPSALLNKIQNKLRQPQLKQLVDITLQLIKMLNDMRNTLQSNHQLYKNKLKRVGQLQYIQKCLQTNSQNLLIMQNSITNKRQFDKLVKDIYTKFNMQLNQLVNQYKICTKDMLKNELGLQDEQSFQDQQNYLTVYPHTYQMIAHVQNTLQQLVTSVRHADSSSRGIRFINLKNNLSEGIEELEKVLFDKESSYNRLIQWQLYKESALQENIYEAIFKYGKFNQQFYKQVLNLYFMNKVLKQLLLQHSQNMNKNIKKAANILNQTHPAFQFQLPTHYINQAQQYFIVLVSTNQQYFQQLFFKKIQKRIASINLFINQSKLHQQKLSILLELQKSKNQLYALKSNIKPLIQNISSKDKSCILRIKAAQEAYQKSVFIRSSFQKGKKLNIQQLNPQLNRIQHLAIKYQQDIYQLISILKIQYDQQLSLNLQDLNNSLSQIQQTIKIVQSYITTFDQQNCAELGQILCDNTSRTIYSYLMDVKKGQSYLYTLSQQRPLQQTQAKLNQKLLYSMVNLQLLICIFLNSQHYSIQRIQGLLCTLSLNQQQSIRSLSTFVSNLKIIIKTFKQGAQFQSNKKLPRLLAASNRRIQIISSLSTLFIDLAEIVKCFKQLYNLGQKPIGRQLLNIYTNYFNCFNKLSQAKIQIRNTKQFLKLHSDMIVSYLDIVQKKLGSEIHHQYSQIKQTIGFLQYYLELDQFKQSQRIKMKELARNKRIDGVKQLADQQKLNYAKFQKIISSMDRINGLLRINQNSNKIDGLKRQLQQLIGLSESGFDKKMVKTNYGQQIIKFL